MDNLLEGKMDFQEYCKLSPEAQQFFVFSTLCRIDERTANLDKKFASKWVETAAKAVAGVTLMGVLAMVLSTVGIHISAHTP